VRVDEHRAIDREARQLDEAPVQGELHQLARGVLARGLEARHVALGEEPVVALEHGLEGLRLDQLERAPEPCHLGLRLVAPASSGDPRLEDRDVAPDVGGDAVVTGSPRSGEPRAERPVAEGATQARRDVGERLGCRVGRRRAEHPHPEPLARHRLPGAQGEVGKELDGATLAVGLERRGEPVDPWHGREEAHHDTAIVEPCALVGGGVERDEGSVVVPVEEGAHPGGERGSREDATIGEAHLGVADLGERGHGGAHDDAARSERRGDRDELPLADDDVVVLAHREGLEELRGPGSDGATESERWPDPNGVVDQGDRPWAAELEHGTARGEDDVRPVGILSEDDDEAPCVALRRTRVELPAPVVEPRLAVSEDHVRTPVEATCRRQRPGDAGERGRGRGRREQRDLDVEHALVVDHDASSEPRAPPHVRGEGDQDGARADREGRRRSGAASA